MSTETKNTPTPQEAKKEPRAPRAPKVQPTLTPDECLALIESCVVRAKIHHERFFLHNIKSDAAILRKCMKEVSDAALYMRKLSLEKRKAMPVKARAKATKPAEPDEPVEVAS